MKQALFVRLAIVLLDPSHTVKAVGLAEGQPRYAVRKALETAVKLCAATPLQGTPRVVLLPAGSGVMPWVMARAIAMSKAGQVVRGLERDYLVAVGRREGMRAWAAELAAQYQCGKAREVAGERISTAG